MIQSLTRDELTTPSSAPSSVYQVREVCMVLGASPSGFYVHFHKPERIRRREDRILAEALKSAFDDSRNTYGSPRLVRQLRKRGLFTSKTRVRRLMKSHSLCPRQKRRVRVKTTRSNPHLPVAPHLLLQAPPAMQPGERFYSDITYIPTQEGWLFTAATLDGYSRRCARAPFGWGVRRTTWKRLWCCGRQSVPWLTAMPSFIIGIEAVNTPVNCSATSCKITMSSKA